MDDKNKIPKAYIALGLSIVAIGISPIFIKLAQAPGTISMFYRMVVAIVFMALPFFHNVKSRSNGLSKKGILFAILGGFFFACDLVFYSTGVMLSGTAKITLLSNTAPIWVGFGAMILFNEKINGWFWGGLILALVGAIFVMGLDHFNLVGFDWGSTLGLISSVFYGGYFLITQRGRKLLDSIPYFWISSLSSAGFLLLVALIFRMPLTGYPLATYLLFLAMGIVGQVIGFMLIGYALGHLPASVVSSTLLLQPVITALLSGVFLGETYSAWQIAGGAAVLAGVFIIQTKKVETISVPQPFL